MENKTRLKIIELYKKGDFNKEILFNGATANGDEFTADEKREIEQGFNKFIQNNIISMMNQEVEFILNVDVHEDTKPFSWDDVENQTSLRYDELLDDILREFEELDEEDKTYILEYENIEDFEEHIKTLDREELDALLNEHSTYLNHISLYDYEENVDVYQWFLVSGWLCDKLSEKEEVIIKSSNYWGRTTSGQSVSLDVVLQDIYLESLEW